MYRPDRESIENHIFCLFCDVIKNSDDNVGVSGIVKL